MAITRSVETGPKYRLSSDVGQREINSISFGAEPFTGQGQLTTGVVGLQWPGVGHQLAIDDDACLGNAA